MKPATLDKIREIVTQAVTDAAFNLASLNRQSEERNREMDELRERAEKAEAALAEMENQVGELKDWATGGWTRQPIAAKWVRRIMNWETP